MRLRRSILGSALAAAALSAGALVPAGAEPPTDATVVAEQDCAEILIPRAADLAATRAEVPVRYALATQTAPSGSVSGRVLLYTYTCRAVTVDGTTAPGTERPTTVSIAAASVTSRDGEALSGFHAYVLWYGTDDPVLHARLRSLGLPSHLLTPGTTAGLDLGSPGTPSHLDWAVHSPLVDYRVRATAVEPAPGTAGGTIYLHHDTARGSVLWAIHNDQIVSTTARVQADLSGATPVTSLLLNPANALIPIGVGINDLDQWTPGFSYGRGSWTSRLTLE